MLRSFRTYRLLTRTVVLVVFMASVLPGVAHACMMADAHDGVLIKKCCCAKSQHANHHDDNHGHLKDEHGHDEMNHGSPEMKMQDKECDDHKPPLNHHDAKLKGDCCQMSLESSSFDVVMSRTNKITQEELLVNWIILLNAQPLLSLSAVQADFGGLQDTGPPSIPPLSLHILYARFLN